MRLTVAALLVLAIASAGCLGLADVPRPDGPGATDGRPGAPRMPEIADATPRETAVGPWRLTATPGAFAGPVGSLARVAVAVERVGDGRAGNVAPAPWARWADVPDAEATRHREIPDGGAEWTLEILVGPTPHLALALWWEDPTGPERWPNRVVNVSDVGVTAGRAVETVSRRDHVPAGYGLAARGEGSKLVATFAEGAFEAFDCHAFARHAGPFRLVEEAGVRTLVGFVESGQSDACWGPAEAHTPRVVATVEDLEAGPVRVRVYNHRTCFCIPSSWTAFETNATIAG